MVRLRQCCGEQPQEQWPPHSGSRRFINSQLTPQSLDALLHLPSCSESPGLMKSGNRGPQLQTVFLGEDDSVLRLPQRLLRFTAQQVDVRGVIRGADDALNVRHLARQCEATTHPLRCTVWIAERPEGSRTCAFADHAGIVAGEVHVGGLAVARVVGQHPVEMSYAVGERPRLDCGSAKRAVRLHDKGWIPKLQGELHQPLTRLPSRLNFSSKHVRETDEPQYFERGRRVWAASAQLPGAPEYLIRLRRRESLGHDQRHGKHQREFQLRFLAFGRIGERGERQQAAVRQRNRLMMCRPPGRVLSSEQQIFHRARGIAPLLEMHRELGGDLGGTIPVDRFSAISDSAMSLGAAHWRQQLVWHVAVEDVTEGVTWRDGAIRQFDESRWQEKLVSPHQRFTSLFHPPGRFLETRSNRN